MGCGASNTNEKDDPTEAKRVRNSPFGSVDPEKAKAFIKEKKDKMYGQTPHPRHVGKMMETCKEMTALIEQCGGDKMRAM